MVSHGDTFLGANLLASIFEVAISDIKLASELEAVVRSNTATYALGGASINIDVRQTKYAVNPSDDDPVYRHVASVTIIGTSTYPGGACRRALRGEDSRRRLAVTKSARNAQGRSVARQVRVGEVSRLPRRVFSKRCVASAHGRCG